MTSKKKSFKITFLSTWPKVNDGIATFCENLAKHLPEKFQGYNIDWSIARVNWIKQLENKDSQKIIFELNYDDPSAYEKLADFLNESDTDVIVIQFINSIYGDFGQHIFRFLAKNQKPVLVVLHSIPMLETQSKLKLKQKILKRFKDFSIDLVVMSDTAKNFLVKKMGFNSSRIFKIYHPSPNFVKISEIEQITLRNKLGFTSEDKIIFTYGILRKDKGILEIIKAIIQLKTKETDLKLLLCGMEVDPKKEYSREIKSLIKKSKIQQHVKFINKFLDQDDIGKYLQISNIFITAQHNLGLHSSGTLAYALSAGSVIISTPTIHAKEILNGAGIIVPAQKPDAIIKAIKKLLDNKSLYEKCRLNSSKIGKDLSWSQSSKNYLKILLKILKSQNQHE